MYDVNRKNGSDNDSIRLEDSIVIGNGQRKIWIDNLKLLAAYGVLIGHCYSLFIGQNPYGQTQLTFPIAFILKATSFFYNGDMWVIVFCILLGYFASSKHSSSLLELIKNTIKRYIRFVEPLIMLAVVIVVLNFMVGFEIRSDYVANQWLGLPMYVTFQGILRMVFTFSYALDGPLWTLRAMFVSGIVMYILNYILDKLKVNHKAIIYSVAMMIAFFIGRRNVSYLLASCCLMGGVLRYCWYPVKKVNGILLSAVVGGIFLLLDGVQNLLASLVPITKLQSLMMVDRKWFAIWWFIVLWLLFSRNDDIERILGARVISKDTNHSFYVYILHTIVIKTAVVWVFSLMMGEIGFGYAVVIATVCCVLLTAVASIAFGGVYKYFHRNIKKLKERILKI